MNQLNFALNNDEIQNIIESTIEYIAAEKILPIIFNKLMENNETSISKQRTTNALKNARPNDMATMPMLHYTCWYIFLEGA